MSDPVREEKGRSPFHPWSFVSQGETVFDKLDGGRRMVGVPVKEVLTQQLRGQLASVTLPNDLRKPTLLDLLPSPLSTLWPSKQCKKKWNK